MKNDEKIPLSKESGTPQKKSIPQIVFTCRKNSAGSRKSLTNSGISRTSSFRFRCCSTCY
jgi:hypothetical protein